MKPDHSLEDFYETLARTIDEVGPDHDSLLLAKLALLLANALDDPERAVALISEARNHIICPCSQSSGRSIERKSGT